MKRFAIAIAFVLACLPLAAQEQPGTLVPPYFSGFQVPEGTWEVITAPEHIAFNPWSVPDPADSDFYYVTEVESNVESINVDLVAACSNGICSQIVSPINELTGNFQWDDRWQAYVLAWVWPDNPKELHYRSWTYLPPPIATTHRAIFNTGCLEAQNGCCPWYEISENCVMYTWIGWTPPVPEPQAIQTWPQLEER